MTTQAQREAAILRDRLAHLGQAVADEVGRIAQTRHQECCVTDDVGSEALWNVARAAARVAPPRLERLRFVVITTDSTGSFDAWIQSLRSALADTGWRPGAGPDVEVLRVANDSDLAIDAAHRRVCADGITIRVADVGLASRPLPISEARPYAFRKVLELGWIPSRRSPVWSLDEDFRFETLVPSPSSMFVRRSGGPLLHRLAALIAGLGEEPVDVLVGGNTGSAPVPALGLVLCQVLDLVTNSVPRGASAWSMLRFSRLADAYYDLSTDTLPHLRIPLARAWWRKDGIIKPDELVRRLQAGTPVTRPALAMPLRHPPNAWATYAHAGIAGGNTVLLSPRAMDASFLHLRYGGLVSRRADTTWAIHARSLGARVCRACLPLLHDRQRNPPSPREAVQESLADALGFGVYQSMLSHQVTASVALAHAGARIVALRGQLGSAEAAARDEAGPFGRLVGLADWLSEVRAALELRGCSAAFFQCCPRREGLRPMPGKN